MRSHDQPLEKAMTRAGASLAASRIRGKLCLTHIGEPIWFDGSLLCEDGKRIAYCQRQRPAVVELPTSVSLPGTFHQEKGESISGMWIYVGGGTVTCDNGRHTYDTSEWELQ